jgi:hypothetical protein
VFTVTIFDVPKVIGWIAVWHSCITIVGVPSVAVIVICELSYYKNTHFVGVAEVIDATPGCVIVSDSLSIQPGIICYN